jgi:hypothetical protein
MSSRSKKALVSWALVSVLFTFACSNGLIKSYAGLNALRQHLIEKYHEDVSVNLQNSRYLSIVFTNSSLNQQDSAKRAQRAQETARFVTLNYEGIKEIDRISIFFVASETRYIVVHYSTTIDAFGFDKNGVAVAFAPNPEVVPSHEDLRTPLARFNSLRNETDVSLTRIQLEGDMNHGIALVPHFTVAGDARRSDTATTAPESVVFDFASYADKPFFSDNAKLEIYCDDRLALSGLARLISGKPSEKDQGAGQFLSVQLSFKLFKRMAESRNLRIVLGHKRFDLLPDDIAALGAMSAYVHQPGDW